MAEVFIGKIGINVPKIQDNIFNTTMCMQTVHVTAHKATLLMLLHTKQLFVNVTAHKATVVNVTAHKATLLMLLHTRQLFVNVTAHKATFVNVTAHKATVC